MYFHKPAQSGIVGAELKTGFFMAPVSVPGERVTRERFGLRVYDGFFFLMQHNLQFYTNSSPWVSTGTKKMDDDACYIFIFGYTLSTG